MSVGEYLDKSSYRAERDRILSQHGRDIGPLPEVLNPERKESARKSLQMFCETYQSDLFHMAWSKDHLKVLKKLEDSVLRGGQAAVAMPRGSGKTTMCLTACSWALLYGHRLFVVLVGAEAMAALEMLDAIRTDFENNDLLLEDFPEVVYPIRCLEGIAHRCNGQLLDGNRTQMSWTPTKVIMPTIPGSKASGAMLKVAGLTGRLRGMQSQTPDGKSIRPDLVIVDDPQTDDSASSSSQNDKRERLLSGAVLGMAGPGKKIAACMPCTVIRHGDMAERILDRKKHPEWHGEITKLVYEWPKNTKLWEQYAEIWAGEHRNNGDGKEATKFYKENQADMDKGSEVAWDARYTSDELSAIQHAWNLRLQIGEESFNAEYQNQPDDKDMESRPISLTGDDLGAKVCEVGRGIVPQEYGRLTAFIDISQKVLWWVVCAFDDKFGGCVIDYGTWPDQKSRYVKLQTAQKTLARKYRGNGIEAATLRGLEDLTANLAVEWRGETGINHNIEKILIDEGDGQHTQIVRNFCRRSELSSMLLAAKGRGVKASSRPLCDGKPKAGERFGYFWKLIRNSDGSRSCHVDVNYWKTFLMRRLEVPRGDSGSLVLFKATPRQHQMFSDQVTAEYPKEMEDVSTGSRVIEWSNPKQRDNHFMDCLVGCLVGASMLGCALTAQVAVKTKVRKRNRVAYI